MAHLLCRFCGDQAELERMDEQTARKTYQYKLKPTPEQVRALGFDLRRCRDLYTAALQERSAAWRKCGVRVTVAKQCAQLPDSKAMRPQ
jgi:putative transposase